MRIVIMNHEAAIVIPGVIVKQYVIVSRHAMAERIAGGATVTEAGIATTVPPAAAIVSKPRARSVQHVRALIGPLATVMDQDPKARPAAVAPSRLQRPHPSPWRRLSQTKSRQPSRTKPR